MKLTLPVLEKIPLGFYIVSQQAQPPARRGSLQASLWQLLCCCRRLDGQHAVAPVAAVAQFQKEKPLSRFLEKQMLQHTNVSIPFVQLFFCFLIFLIHSETPLF